MRVEESLSGQELTVIDPPTFVGKLVGMAFLVIGIVLIGVVCLQTFQKVNQGDHGAIAHSAVSIGILIVFFGIPGLLFGFQTNRVHIHREDLTVTKIRDFCVYQYKHTENCQKFSGISLRRRTEKPITKSHDGSSSRTRYYVDIVLVDSTTRKHVLGTELERHTECACQTARQISKILELPFLNEDQFCEPA